MTRQCQSILTTSLSLNHNLIFCKHNRNAVLNTLKNITTAMQTTWITGSIIVIVDETVIHQTFVRPTSSVDQHHRTTPQTLQ